MLSNKVSTNTCDKFARRGGDCKRAFSPNTPRDVRVAAAGYDAAQSGTSNDSLDGFEVGRRQALAALVTVPAILQANAALAVQGLTAGRIPGVSSTADADGFYRYTRPEGKSGGHGVGWSEMPRYTFKVRPGWEETPVSIADLGGTEIDLRFACPEEGSLQVVVAPVLRFADVGYNADVRITDLNKPENIISGFAPELFGRPLDDEDVLEQRVLEKEGVPYYEWQVKPHNLVSATAVGNRVFILNITPRSSRTFAKTGESLRRMQESFYVPADYKKLT
uniref:PsbP C-terminal domain-containing protein n=1 Tax=Tetradesmus obliquus TaxID=3088 RepID=A0A383VDK8_TETOB|eukprot:jgi/Sobl393_1/8476/SZX62792.1